MATDTVKHESTLSDALLRQLIAVGQVDVLVGLPTLNNAATIIDTLEKLDCKYPQPDLSGEQVE